MQNHISYLFNCFYMVIPTQLRMYTSITSTMNSIGKVTTSIAKALQKQQTLLKMRQVQLQRGQI